MAIKLHEVSFRYGPKDPVVPRDIALRLAPCEWVSLSGPSGRGKTRGLKPVTGPL